MKPYLSRFAMLALLGLAACDNARDDMVANSKICAVWKTPSANVNTAAANAAAANGAAVDPNVIPAGDPASPVDICVRRWAYSLASSRDSADIVAEAAVAACAPVIAGWNQGSAGAPEGQEQAMSLTTGQPTNAMAEHANFAHNQALLYVVEARAGRCKPPAVVNGAPVGS